MNDEMLDHIMTGQGVVLLLRFSPSLWPDSPFVVNEIGLGHDNSVPFDLCTTYVTREDALNHFLGLKERYSG